MTKTEVINCMIASCVSADNNFFNFERKENIRLLKKLLKEVKLSEKQSEQIQKGIETLKKEIKENPAGPFEKLRYKLMLWKADRNKEKLIKKEETL